MSQAYHMSKMHTGMRIVCLVVTTPCSYQAGAVLEPLMEVDVPSLHSQLTLSRGADPASLPTAFAWLVGGTICHGHLRLRQYAGVNGEEVGEAAEYVADMRQLRLNGDEEGTSPEEEPTCMV